MVLQYTTSHFALCCRRLSLMCSMGHSRYICTLLNVPSNARCNDVLIRYACLVLQKIGVDYHWWLVFTDSTTWIRTTSLYIIHTAFYSLGSLQLQSHTKVCQLTLVRLIAVVGETVGTATNQTQLASLTTGRVAHSSWRWSPNVHMHDCEGVARLLRGTA